MSSGHKRTKIVEVKKVDPIDLAPELHSAFEKVTDDINKENEEQVWSNLPLEELEEKVLDARKKFGCSVSVRHLDDGTVVISPRKKRIRGHEESEDIFHDPSDDNSSNASKDLDPDNENKRRKTIDEDDEDVDPTPVGSILDDPAVLARHAFVQRVRDGIQAVLPTLQSEESYRIEDMGDVNFDIRYQGLIGGEDLPDRFRFKRYPAMAVFMNPASHDRPYILQKGDLLYFKRQGQGLPVLECLHSTGKTPYWAALCYIPRNNRNLVWQDTSTAELPADQLFRIIALSYVDWSETMRMCAAMDAVQMVQAERLWSQISAPYGDHLPAALKRVISQGLCLTAGPKDQNPSKDEPSKPPAPDFDEIEESHFEPNNRNPSESDNKDKPDEGKPPRRGGGGKNGPKPLVEYGKLHSALVKVEKCINTVVKDQGVIKTALKAHSKALEQLSETQKTIQGGNTPVSGDPGAIASRFKETEAHIKSVSSSVAGLSIICKELRASQTDLAKKLDTVLADKSRMTWEEFSQRQKDILSLNQHLAAPLQAFRSSSQPLQGLLPQSGLWPSSYVEGLPPTGQMAGLGAGMGYAGVPSAPVSIHFPATGASSSFGHGGFGTSKIEEQKQEASATVLSAPLGSDTASSTGLNPSVSIPGGMGNEELVRLLLQQLNKGDGAGKK